jgi:hypothetical protein
MCKRLLMSVLVIVALAAPAAAQTQITTGVIQGAVADATGGVLPGVDVEARNVDTNLSRNVVTDRDGRFIILQLPPGRYTVTFKLSGFATLVQENVPLTVGQALTLNSVMKVSGVAETVTVQAQSGVVDITRTEAASTLNQTTVETTPILGRKFEDLLTLTPGVSVVQGPDGDEITFNGQRGIFNNFSLDGGDYNNGFFGEQMGGQRAAIDITLEAVKEFQVVATGANAEFGRTAGGVVNVITKSGTNQVHGNLFEYQRLEALTSNTSDGKPLKDFHREQFGGTIGGPIVKDKAFFFLALEGIRENLQRPNLSEQIGSTACPVSAPTIVANEALINSNADCQRLALLNFLRTSRNQEEGQPVNHNINNNAVLGKLDWVLSANNNLSISSPDYSKNNNQTFDVASYGNSANGIEGPSKIQVLNLNLFTTVSTTKVNEFHITYSRENRPRAAASSNVPADTGMNFGPDPPSFRFGNPFFLGPTVDELIERFQFKDNFTIISGRHTIKTGGEWIHTNNVQVFRGFFEGRYLFDTVAGFLRYASPEAAGGYGPRVMECSSGTWVTAPTACPAGTSVVGPLLLYLQGAGLQGPATDAAGFSDINNEEFALFIQDKWQVTPRVTLNYGLRWDAQLMPSTVDPQTTAYAKFLNDPRFPSDGTIPDQWKQFQPRVGLAWDVKGDGKSVIRGSGGLYYARQNMLTQVGSVTTNGIQQQTLFFASFLNEFGVPPPTWPGVLTPTPVPPGQFPAGTGVRVFDGDYKNPRISTFNVAFEQEVGLDWAVCRLHVCERPASPRFLDYNRADRGAPFSRSSARRWLQPAAARTLQGATFGIRKRFSEKYQLEASYVLSKDEDDDSNSATPSRIGLRSGGPGEDYGPRTATSATSSTSSPTCRCRSSSFSTSASRRGRRSPSQPRSVS